MSNSNLFIPKKIRVGYQEKDDTYSKKLGYVIYYDQKNTLRKEKSFNGWIDKNIAVDDFDNVPTSGFVLNKKVGGNTNYSWNPRNTYSRVYDPRGFEFEITIPNLLFILEECNSFKGKGLDGEFVYSWDGKELVLLPVESLDYKKCCEYTDLQSAKLTKKDFIVGHTYLSNKMDEFVYLGYHQFYDRYSWRWNVKGEKKHIFLSNMGEYRGYGSKYFTPSTLSMFKRVVSDTVIDNFAFILDEFLESEYHQDYIEDKFYQYGDNFKSDYNNVLKTPSGKIEIYENNGKYSYKKQVYNMNGRYNYEEVYLTEDEIKATLVAYHVMKNGKIILA